jgi:6-hydroxytryprostatin B O-methyltransferase
MFQEDDAGYFSHTAASAALARNRHLRDIVMLLTHELSYLLVRLSDTLKQQQEQGVKQQQEQGENGPQSAFNLAFPDYVNIFQYFSENTTGSLRYHNYLKGRGNMSRWAVDHLLVAWDWSSVGKKTIVDVSSKGQK